MVVIHYKTLFKFSLCALLSVTAGFLIGDKRAGPSTPVASSDLVIEMLEQGVQPQTLVESLNECEAAVIVSIDPSRIFVGEDWERQRSFLNKVAAIILSQPERFQVPSPIDIAAISRLGDTERVTFDTESGWILEREMGTHSGAMTMIAQRWLRIRYQADHGVNTTEWHILVQQAQRR